MEQAVKKGVSERVIGYETEGTRTWKGVVEMKTRETLRSFFIRNAAWKLQRYLIPSVHPGKERQKEITRLPLEHYEQVHAVSL